MQKLLREKSILYNKFATWFKMKLHPHHSIRPLYFRKGGIFYYGMKKATLGVL